MAQQHRTKKQSAASRKQRRETLLARMGWRMKKPRTGRVEIQSDEIPIVEGIAPYVNGYLEGYIDGQESIPLICRFRVHTLRQAEISRWSGA